MKKAVLRNTSSALLVTLAALWLPIAPVHAALIDTSSVATMQPVAPAADARQQLRDLLGREDVAALLQEQGLDRATALARVEALTDAEVNQLAQHLDQLPAGGDFLTLAFVTFMVLLATDILGFTKIFPFTRSVR
ncbi:MAG: PA2779 family protein [Spongiibacteraceae bacterium]|jgi:hypothetical protein|nr:PA2779 family protein [Spongiibacteraceae bacterium]